MLKRKKLGQILTILCFFCVFIGSQVFAAEDSSKDLPDSYVITDGVFIGEVDVSGMTKAEAGEAVEQWIASRSEAVISIQFHEETSEISMKDLDFEWRNPLVIEEALLYGNRGNLLERYMEKAAIEKDRLVLDLNYNWSRGKLRAFLEEEGESHRKDPVEATIRRDRTEGVFVITESVTGLKVDTQATVKLVTDYLATEWQGGDVTLEAVTEVTEPRLTTQMCRSIQDLLGEYSTEYNPAERARTTNLATGCGYIDGVVLLPGESLSFFDYLYPCTYERGYRTAIAYQNGRYIDSIGGGICQVSTTCYNAVLLAELEVVTRFPHTMKVSYVKPGLDSGQAYSSGRNLTFANNTDAPVYVEAYIHKVKGGKGGELYIGLWGKETRPANRTVRYDADYEETWVYGGVPVYTYDPSRPYGEEVITQGEYPKIVATAYKEVYIDGKKVSTEIMHTDRYRATPPYVRVGTGGLTAEEYLAGVLPPAE